jgi:hypothetical protein
MALTKATFSMIAGAPVNVDDFVPAGTNTATTDCAAFIQAAIDAASAAGGTSVVFSTKSYRIDSTIQIKANNTVIDGRTCELDYYGANVAFDFIPLGGTTYPVSCRISNIGIRVRTAVTGTGFRIRASYSVFENIGVVLYVAATNARGITLIGDEANGTGPYYNQFFNYAIQSQSSGLDHVGISFVSTAPIHRAPNANTFYGGRVGQCAQGIVIKGNGNSFFNPTIENAAATGTAIKFEADTAVNCVQNNVFGCYIENANIGVLFGASSNANSIYSMFQTGVATAVSDLGVLNLIVDTNVPSQLPSGVNPNGTASANPEVLDAYEEGAWTPTLVGGTTAGSYTVTTTSAKYTRIGQQVTVTAGMVITINSAGTGVLTFGGLPFAKDSFEFITGSVALDGTTLNASTRSLSIGSNTSSTESNFIISQTRTGATILPIDCADVVTGFQVFVTFTYAVLN